MLQRAVCLVVVSCATLLLAADQSADSPAPKAKKVAKDKDGARAKEIATFFDGPLQRFEFEIKPETMQQLRDTPRAYSEVKFNVANETWKNVALKLKGADGSFKPIDDKPGLTLDFDKFKGASRYHGQKKFHLNNANEDPSFLREWLMGEIARIAGVPAGRCTHAFVSINGKDKGLYVVREGFTKDFLAQHYGTKDGALFEGHFCKDIDDQLELDLGDNAARERLKKLVAVCENDGPDQWTRLSEVLDLERYARFLAFEALVEFSDSYDFYKNNYRIYLAPKSQKFEFILHGMDQAMMHPEESVQRGPSSRVGAIFWRHPEGQRLYRAHLTELYEKVLAAGDWPARLEKRITFVTAAMKAQGSKKVGEFTKQAEALKGDLLKRIESVGAQIAEWPEPLTFDAKGIAALPKQWRTDTDNGEIEHEETDAALRLIAKDDGVGSWRRAVMLDPGRYRFEAETQTKSVEAIDDEKGKGAGLRISGAKSKRPNSLAGDAKWTLLGYEFEVTETREVILVAELRARKGEALFARDSLRLVQVR